MRSFLKIMLVFGFLVTIWWGLSACRGGLNKKIDSLEDKMVHKIPAKDIFVAPDYDKDRPLSVAILPF